MKENEPTTGAPTESKGKGKAVESVAETHGMDVDDSSSEEEMDEVRSPSPYFHYSNTNNIAGRCRW